MPVVPGRKLLWSRLKVRVIEIVTTIGAPEVRTPTITPSSGPESQSGAPGLILPERHRTVRGKARNSTVFGASRDDVIATRDGEKGRCCKFGTGSDTALDAGRSALPPESGIRALMRGMGLAPGSRPPALRSGPLTRPRAGRAFAAGPRAGGNVPALPTRMIASSTHVGRTSQRHAARGRRAPVFHVLIAVTLAAPLPLGAYPDWAWASIAAICGALVVLWGVSILTRQTAACPPPVFVWWSASAMASALLWATLQTAGFMPEGWHHPLWRDAAEALGMPYHGAISLDPQASRESILRMVSYVGVFWLALQYGHDPGRAPVRVVRRGGRLHLLCALRLGGGVFRQRAYSVV